MGLPTCNTTLYDSTITETPLFGDTTFHKLGAYLSAAFGLIAIAISLLLILLHAIHYSRPHEQRHIIRILFMIPVYAAQSFLSYIFYKHSVYFEVLRDCYEAFAIASFFSLLCAYITPTLHDQKEYFRGISPKPWIWPLGKMQHSFNGKLRTPRSGLTWFNVIWVSVFQYCVIRVFFTIVSVITEAFGRYCLESLNPGFAHVWVMVIEAISVTIAMYCLIQFYVQIKDDIASHRPFMKILAIKLVIFLSFWQSILISFLTSSGAIKATEKIQTPDIKVGIPAMLLCIEMAFFSILHIWSFSWKPYILNNKVYSADDNIKGETERYHGGFMGVKALVDSMNPWDMWKAIGRGGRWLFHGRKHRHNDPSYQMKSDQVTEYNTSTSFGVEGRPPQYEHGGNSREEESGLLGNAQQMGITRPGNVRTEHSPYRGEIVSDWAPQPSNAGVPNFNYGAQGQSMYQPPMPYQQSQTEYMPPSGPPPGRGRQL
jgi:hypothetical protein